MSHAAEILTQLGIAHEVKVVSAHRTPERMVAYAQQAKARGLQVIIAGAGGAAHLPGMTAALTSLPVLRAVAKELAAIISNGSASQRNGESRFNKIFEFGCTLDGAPRAAAISESPYTSR